MMNAYMQILDWYRIFHRLNEVIDYESINTMHPYERDIRIGLHMEDVERAKEQNRQP